MSYQQQPSRSHGNHGVAGMVDVDMNVRDQSNTLATVSKTATKQENGAENAAIATATPGGKLKAPTEKVLRRRMQYKLHQRRHRAKQKQKTMQLELEVTELNAEIAKLKEQWLMLDSHNVFASRGLMTGAPAKVAMEYFRIFEYGHCEDRALLERQFMQAAMVDNLEGPDYVGLEFVLEQWRLYTEFFATCRIEAKSYDIATVGDMTMVTASIVFHLRPRREGVTSLLPNLTGNEELIQEVVGKCFQFTGKYRFMFEPSGIVSWLGADIDFVSGLQAALGSLRKVAAFMQDACMSFNTGQIARSSHTRRVCYTDAHSSRFELAYLLS